jgi:hypothetical protein
MLNQRKPLPLLGSCPWVQSLEKEMGDILRFNNKLSFLKSVTTLIVPLFLGIANDGNKEAHSEE